jgi:hypothetical protein
MSKQQIQSQIQPRPNRDPTAQPVRQFLKHALEQFANNKPKALEKDLSVKSAPAWSVSGNAVPATLA